MLRGDVSEKAVCTDEPVESVESVIRQTTCSTIRSLCLTTVPPSANGPVSGSKDLQNSRPIVMQRPTIAMLAFLVLAIMPADHQAFAQAPNDRPADAAAVGSGSGVSQQQGGDNVLLLGLSPAGISYTHWVSSGFGIGAVIESPWLGIPIGEEDYDEPNILLSGSLVLEFGLNQWIVRAGPGAFLLSGNDWAQVYPGFQAGVRRPVRLLGATVDLGVEVSSARVAGGNGTGNWTGRIGPFVGIRL
jgi:hypothetical protein